MKRIISMILIMAMVITAMPMTAKPVDAASKKSISKASITLSCTSYSYNGSAKKPSVKVIYSNKALKNGTDYTVSYGNNVKPGKAYATIKGKGKYTGSVKKYFTINEVNVVVKGTSLVTKDYTFIGKATDTFNWSYKASTKQITSLTCTQSCSGIKSLSTLKKISKTCTKKTSTTQEWTTVYGLYLPQPIKVFGSWQFAKITSKYRISGNKLTTVSRKWTWSLVENW